MADVDTATQSGDQAPAVSAPAGDTKSETVPQPTQQQTLGEGAALETPAVPLTAEQQIDYEKLPPDVRKAFNRVLTQKFQEHSAKLREADSAVQLVEALKDERQREMAIKYLAESSGFQLVKPEAKAETDQKEQIFAKLAEQFGPEPAQHILSVAEAIAEKKTNAALEPLKAHVQAQTQEMVKADTKSALDALSAKDPNWKNYEPDMTALGQRWPKPESMSRSEYAMNLYYLASRDKSTAQTVKEVAERMQKSAQSAETPTSGVASNRVAATLPSKGTFAEKFKAAADLAKRGQTVER